MQKPQRRKLEIKRDTVRRLDLSDLERVAGAGWSNYLNNCSSGTNYSSCCPGTTISPEESDSCTFSDRCC